MKKLILILFLFCACAKKDETQPIVPPTTTPPPTGGNTNQDSSFFWGNYTLVSQTITTGWQDSLLQFLHMENPSGSFANNGFLGTGGAGTYEIHHMINANLHWYLTSDTSASIPTSTFVGDYVKFIYPVDYLIKVYLLHGEISVSGKYMWMNLWFKRIMVNNGNLDTCSFSLTYKKP